MYVCKHSSIYISVFHEAKYMTFKIIFKDIKL